MAKSLNPFGFFGAESVALWLREEAHPAIQLFYNLGFVLILIMMIAGCATDQQGVRVVQQPVPTPVRCVNPADIPAEPPQVGDQFNGDAKHDLGILAPNALELRAWGRSLRALIVPACTIVLPTATSARG